LELLQWAIEKGCRHDQSHLKLLTEARKIPFELDRIIPHLG
jgi:hypothetical protein